MQLQDILKLYAGHAQSRALAKLMGDSSVRRASVSGLTQSALALHLALPLKGGVGGGLVILRDADEAGYMYQDLQNMGVENVLFFPSSYKRAVKFGQRDAASEVMRAEVLTSITSHLSPLPLTS